MSDDTPDVTPAVPEGPGGGLADLFGGLGGGGGLGDLFAQAQEAMAASQAAAEQEVTGSAGGGVVRVRATGIGEVLAVEIAPEVVDPDDIETLQDLVLAALRDVNHQVTQLQASAMGSLDPGSMLGGLSGLFGDEDDDADDDGYDDE